MATIAPKIPKTAREQAEKLLATYAQVGQQLSQLAAERKPLEDKYAKLRRDMQAWADEPANAGEFGDKQTVSLAMGSFGYRTGTEKLDFVLDTDLDEAARTAAVVAAVKAELPTALKESYDPKAVIKAWEFMPGLREKLSGIVAGVKRGQDFLIKLK